MGRRRLDGERRKLSIPAPREDSSCNLPRPARHATSRSTHMGDTKTRKTRERQGGVRACRKKEPSFAVASIRFPPFLLSSIVGLDSDVASYLSSLRRCSAVERRPCSQESKRKPPPWCERGAFPTVEEASFSSSSSPSSPPVEGEREMISTRLVSFRFPGKNPRETTDFAVDSNSNEDSLHVPGEEIKMMTSSGR